MVIHIQNKPLSIMHKYTHCCWTQEVVCLIIIDGFCFTQNSHPSNYKLLIFYVECQWLVSNILRSVYQENFTEGDQGQGIQIWYQFRYFQWVKYFWIFSHKTWRRVAGKERQLRMGWAETIPVHLSSETKVSKVWNHETGWGNAYVWLLTMCEKF
jgi:hypothetical protein